MSIYKCYILSKYMYILYIIFSLSISISQYFNLYISISFFPLNRALYRDRHICRKSPIVGYARSKLSVEELVENARPHIKVRYCLYSCSYVCVCACACVLVRVCVCGCVCVDECVLAGICIFLFVCLLCLIF